MSFCTGLNEVTAACCGSGFLNAPVGCGRPVPSTMPGITSELCRHPSKFLFWDAFHPTEAVVRMLFKVFWTGGDVSLMCMLLLGSDVVAGKLLLDFCHQSLLRRSGSSVVTPNWSADVMFLCCSFG